MDIVNGCSAKVAFLFSHLRQFIMSIYFSFPFIVWVFRILHFYFASLSFVYQFFFKQVSYQPARAEPGHIFFVSIGNEELLHYCNSIYLCAIPLALLLLHHVCSGFSASSRPFIIGSTHAQSRATSPLLCCSSLCGQLVERLRSLS